MVCCYTTFLGCGREVLHSHFGSCTGRLFLAVGALLVDASSQKCCLLCVRTEQHVSASLNVALGKDVWKHSPNG